MFLRCKIFWRVGLVAFLATGSFANAAIAASTNPWAMPQQQGQGQGNAQGGFNMGGGFTFGGNTQQQSNLAPPQFVAPAPVIPQQAVPQQVVPQQVVPQPQAPVAPRQQFGIYPPLTTQNSPTRLGPAQPARPLLRQPVSPYYQPQPYGYGQMPFGFNPGFGGFNNFGFGFGFGGGMGNGLIAPGPVFPGYANPYYQGYGAPRYQARPQVR